MAAKLGSAYVSIRARLDKLEKDLDTAKSTTIKKSKEISSSVSTVMKGAVAYFGVSQLTSFASELLNVGKSVQSLNKSYAEITGSTAEANKEFDFLRTTADALGQNFYTLADGYKQILASSKDTNLEGENTQKIFTGIVKAGSSLGMSNEDLKLSLKAISDMMSKGTVSAEELKGQLGDHLPGALNLAAQAMGKTTQELLDMMSNGELLAEDLLPKLADLLQSKYSGAASEAVRASNKMEEAWMDAKVAMAESGFIDSLTEAMQNLTEVISNPAIHDALANMASGFGWVIEKASELINVIGDLADNATMMDQAMMLSESGLLDWSEFMAQSAEGKHQMVQEIMAQTKAANSFTGKISDAAGYEDYISDIKEQTASAKTAVSESTSKGKSKRKQDLDSVIRDYFDAVDEIEDGLYDALSYSTQQTDESLVDFFGDVDEYENILNERKKLLEDSSEEYIDLWRIQANDMEEVQANALLEMEDDVQSYEDKMKDAFTGWATSYASTLNDMLWESEFTFSAIAESFAKMITQMMIQESLTSAAGWLTSLDWSGLTGASVMHSGRQGVKRNVPSSLFVGAPRLHDGLNYDEFPAILQKGETVTPKGESGRGNNFSVNVNNQSGQDVSANDVKVVEETPGNYVANLIIKKKRISRSFRRSLLGD